MKPIHAPTHLYFYSVDRVVAVKIFHLKKVDFGTYPGSRIELGFLFLSINRGMSKRQEQGLRSCFTNCVNLHGLLF